MTEQQFNDIVHILQYIMQKLPPTDSVRAAMLRLVPPPTTVGLEELKKRRSNLIMQRATVADKRKHLNEVAAQANAHWADKRTADQANAEYDAICTALAEVEAAIKEAA
jgi:hypothetical protein